MYQLEVAFAGLLHSWCQLHYWVVEQCEVSSHAVVALRCADGNKLLADVDDVYLEVAALAYVFYEVVSGRDDEAVACFKRMLAAVMLKRAAAAVAVCVA